MIFQIKMLTERINYEKNIYVTLDNGFNFKKGGNC